MEDHIGKTVTPTGIWLHSSGIIGASPDGFVDLDKVVEIKCLPRYEGKLHESLHDPKQKSKNILFYEDSILVVNKTHEFYHQIQGQMYMANRDSCYLVLFTEKDVPVIQIIGKDKDWEPNLSILTNFYFENFIPYIMSFLKLK